MRFTCMLIMGCRVSIRFAGDPVIQMNGNLWVNNAHAAWYAVNCLVTAPTSLMRFTLIPCTPIPSLRPPTPA